MAEISEECHFIKICLGLITNGNAAVWEKLNNRLFLYVKISDSKDTLYIGNSLLKFYFVIKVTENIY